MEVRLYFDYFPVRYDGHTSGHHARPFKLESNQIVDIRVPASSAFSSSSIVVPYIPRVNAWETSAQLQ